MCGIAGVIHKGTKANVGGELTAMLQSLKHRGPDSTGFALYHQEATDNHYIMRCKVAEQEDLASGFDIHETISQRKAAVYARLQELGAKVIKAEDATEYAQRYTFEFDGDLKRLIDFIEDLDEVEILSVGTCLELVKDLGDSTVVSNQYGLNTFQGHARDRPHAHGD